MDDIRYGIYSRFTTRTENYRYVTVSNPVTGILSVCNVDDIRLTTMTEKIRYFVGETQDRTYAL